MPQTISVVQQDRLRSLRELAFVGQIRISIRDTASDFAPEEWTKGGRVRGAVPLRQMHDQLCTSRPPPRSPIWWEHLSATREKGPKATPPLRPRFQASSTTSIPLPVIGHRDLP